jgi:hypothetical protein
MNYSRICRMSMIAIVGLGTIFMPSGCSRHDSGGSGSADAGGSTGASATAAPASSITGTGDPDAVSAVQAELEKHWVQTPDGWITVYPPGHSSDVLFRDSAEQIKELKFEIKSHPLSDADKLNQIQYSASCTFPHLAIRSFGSNQMSGPENWTEWSTKFPDVVASVQKQNGQWQVSGGEELLNGTKPDESALAALK